MGNQTFEVGLVRAPTVHEHEKRSTRVNRLRPPNNLRVDCERGGHASSMQGRTSQANGGIGSGVDLRQSNRPGNPALTSRFSRLSS